MGTGSTRQLINSGASVTDSYTNDAYGNSIASSGRSTNPMKWNGGSGYGYTPELHGNRVTITENNGSVVNNPKDVENCLTRETRTGGSACHCVYELNSSVTARAYSAASGSDSPWTPAGRY